MSQTRWPAMLRSEPDWTLFLLPTPPAIRSTPAGTHPAEDPAEHLAGCSRASLLLSELELGSPGPVQTEGSRSAKWLAAVVAGGVVGAAALFLVIGGRQTAEDSGVSRLVIAPPIWQAFCVSIR